MTCCPLDPELRETLVWQASQGTGAGTLALIFGLSRAELAACLAPPTAEMPQAPPPKTTTPITAAPKTATPPTGTPKTSRAGGATPKRPRRKSWAVPHGRRRNRLARRLRSRGYSWAQIGAFLGVSAEVAEGCLDAEDGHRRVSAGWRDKVLAVDEMMAAGESP